MRVFVTGATGYIGSAVTAALARAEHTVDGLARSPEAAARLEARGVTPVRGDLGSPETVAAAARAADGVIHTAMGWGADTPQLDEAATRAIAGALAGSGRQFVYTSGVWVVGDTAGRTTGESAAIHPTPLVAWRPAVEQIALNAVEQKVRGVVIRPAMVFGRGGGMVGQWVADARRQGFVRVVGNGENHWSFVHVDDLADLYVRALERSPAGEIYLAAFGPAYPTKVVAEAASVAGGAGGKVEFWPVAEARRQMGPYADALVLDQKIASTKAGRLLGWAPKGPTVLDDLARA